MPQYYCCFKEPFQKLLASSLTQERHYTLEDSIESMADGADKANAQFLNGFHTDLLVTEFTHLKLVVTYHPTHNVMLTTPIIPIPSRYSIVVANTAEDTETSKMRSEFSFWQKDTSSMLVLRYKSKSLQTANAFLVQATLKETWTGRLVSFHLFSKS